MNEVQNTVTGQSRNVHMARMPSYANASLEISSEMKDIFKMTRNQGDTKLPQMSLSVKTPSKLVNNKFRWLG